MCGALRFETWALGASGPQFESLLFPTRCLPLPHAVPHLTNGGNHVPSSLVPGTQGTLHDRVTSPEPTGHNEGNPKLARLPGEVEALRYPLQDPLFFSWGPCPAGVGATKCYRLTAVPRGQRHPATQPGLLLRLGRRPGPPVDCSPCGAL